MKSFYKKSSRVLTFLIVSILLILLVNQGKAQSVAITTPATNSTFTAGNVIAVYATATAPALGIVNKVVFTMGTVSATVTTYPYNAGLPTSTLAPGTYPLTATNYYTPFLGTQTTISTTISVTITSPTAATYGNYAFSKVLNLNSGSLGITSNLTNFPALVYIQDNALMVSGSCTDKVQNPTGTNYDFAFTLPGSTTELNYQVEKYDPVAGTLLVWVKIPSLIYADNTFINFYFGAKTPPVTHDNTFYANTWTSDYLAVYHFNEGSSTATILDATTNARNATQTNTTPGTGEITSGYQFNGTTSQILTTSASNNITGSFTLSAWVNTTSLTGHTDQKIITNQYSYSAGGYKLGLYGTSGTTVYDEVETRSATGTASLDRTATGGTAITAGAWHYVQGVYNSSNNTFYSYIDGKLDRSLTGAVAAANGNIVYIGSDFNAGNWFYGTIDEARISNVAKSSDWIKAEYTNQSSPITFTTSYAVTTNQTNAAAIPGALVYTYKGATGTYTDPTNWDNTTTGVANQAPAFDGTATLVIPTGKNLTLNSNASVYGITLNGTATLTLSGYNLNVGCNVYNQGTGKIYWNNNDASKITWNGSVSAQSYNGATTGGYAHIGSMEVNNSAGGKVTVNSDTLDIYHELKITKGNLAVAPGGILILKSTATETAEIPAIPSGYSISGTVSAERFYTGGTNYRGYRFISSPVNAGSGVYSINYLLNSCYVTGTTGTAGGFDKQGNPTIYIFRENMAPAYTSFTNSCFRGINNITASPVYELDSETGTYSIPVGNGVLFFFRGNRNAAPMATETTPTYVPTSATTLASGLLNQGTITVRDWYTPASVNLGYTTTAGNSTVRGWNLMGNPYPSAIDWDLFSSTTSTAAIYGPYLTGYIYMRDQVTKNYGAYLAGSGGIGTDNATHIIPSGVGFFVHTINASAQLIFTEAAKVPTQVTGTALFMGKPVASSVNQYLRFKLSKDSLNYDENIIRFNSQAHNAYDPNEDAIYFSGDGVVGMSNFSSDSVGLAINQLPLPKQDPLTIRLRVYTTTSGSYQLQMEDIVAVPQLFDIWLMDAYKKDSVDMRINPNYTFSIDKSDTNSFGNNRFKLVIRQNQANAYHLLSFAATKSTASVQLGWTTANEQNYTYFTVECSTDNGATFNIIGNVPATGEGAYSLIDKNPFVGTNLYRLKQQYINSTITYSNVIPVVFSDMSNTLNGRVSVFPNPASSMIHVNVLLQTQQNPLYSITITNSSGLQVLNSKSSTADWQGNVGQLLPGSYVIVVTNTNDKTEVGRAKFVKLNK